jgi:hypothetical protein
MWNPSNAINYATTDSQGWVTFHSCIINQGTYSGYTAAPGTLPGGYRLMVTTLGGWQSTGCSYASIAPGSIYNATGTKDGNGILPVTTQLTCMVALPPPPPPPPQPTPTPAPTPAPTPTPSPTPSPTPAPTPTPLNSPPPVTKSPSPSPTVKKVSPPPPIAPAIVNTSSNSQDKTPPSQPTDLSASYSGNGVNLTWSASTDNVRVLSYTIERSTDQNNWENISTGILETSFDDLAAIKGMHYFYRIRAIDAAGNESVASFAEIEIPAGVEVQQTNAPIVAKKNSSASRLIKATGGVLLIFLAIGGGTFWLVRRRISLRQYNDKILDLAPEHTIQGVEITPPHNTETLKEMVLHDMPRKGPDQK